MRSTFKEKIRDLIDTGVYFIDDLRDRDKCQLTAAYLKEADHIEQWEFITEPPGCETLPLLLIDLLEGQRNGPLSLFTPDITLATTLARAAVDWCLDDIEDAIRDALADKRAEESYDKPITLRYQEGHEHE